MNKLKSILFALLLMPLSSAMADVSCPSGYTTVSESDVYVSLTGSCPSGHTQVGGEYGGDNVQNCIDSLANGASVCTFYETSCQSGKYFDGTSHQICQAGAYCDGSGTATPGVSSCSSSCPANSNSSAGATSCTCNTGYNYNGGTTTTTGACTANTYTVAYDCNGGTGSTTATATYMDVFTPNTNVCARTGYEFVEWTMDGSAVGDSFTYNYTSDKTLVAVWKQSSVTCEAGEYLPANSTSCSSCLSGSYCPGGTYVMSDTDIGLNPCPANSNSSAGATSCTCNDTYTVTGLLGGNIQTTTADCKKISCGAGNILINGSCAKAEFTITTTDMDAGTDFSFEISASGTYYIDWGDGSDVQKIEKTDLASRTYHHTYTSSGVRTIGMYGDATGYTSTLYVGAISFRGNNYIDKVGGSLGAIFSGSAHSMFYYTFYECRSLTEIPSTLFDGVTGNNPWMFGYTFRNCTSLKAIPEN
ncbi:MAG: InlB B-repeat-containing protein, partial [Alphaproteobacteria bacterium]|nr:InlB B-repeat-containing protein [Alphaproteobacteria bacterium]